MSNDRKEEGESSPETKKVLTPKELLEKRKQHLAQTQANRGFGHGGGSHSKGSTNGATGHKPRVHRPQGG